MGALFWLLPSDPASFAEADLSLLAVWLTALTSAAAVQDVALDAWAVEGLPSAEEWRASAVQQIGLFSASLVVLAAVSAKVDPATVACFAGVVAIGGAVVALSFAASAGTGNDPSPGPAERETLSLAGSYAAVWAAVRSKEVAMFLAAVVTSAVVFSADGAATVALVGEGRLQPDALAKLETVVRVATVVLMPLITRAVIERCGPTESFKILTRWETLIAPLGIAWYWAVKHPTLLLPDDEGSGSGSGSGSDLWPPSRFTITTLALEIPRSVLHSATFVCTGAMVAAISARYEPYRAAVLTLGFAASNFGRSISATAVSFAFDHVAEGLHNIAGGPIDPYYPLAGTLLVLALVMRRYALSPAMRHLRITCLTSKQPK